jgi:2-phospho-L-lactate/phosphoenolpyruvate guanylyltransferase
MNGSLSCAPGKAKSRRVRPALEPAAPIVDHGPGAVSQAARRCGVLRRARHAMTRHRAPFRAPTELFDLDRSPLWAVVPVKDLHDAKQRLAGVLSAKERQALFCAMLEDVLCALAGCEGLAGILVVTRDPQARDLARRYGVEVLADANRGHTAASTLGALALAQRGVAGMVQVPADIPLLTPGDVAALLEAHGEAPAITLAPSRDERGSNAVVCSPADALPLRFGDGSFHPHVQRARALGIEPRIVRRPGLALDVDTPDDLAAFLVAPSQTCAYAYLVRNGIAERLKTRAADPGCAPG